MVVFIGTTLLYILGDLKDGSGTDSLTVGTRRIWATRLRGQASGCGYAYNTIIALVTCYKNTALCNFLFCICSILFIKKITMVERERVAPWQHECENWKECGVGKEAMKETARMSKERMLKSVKVLRTKMWDKCLAWRLNTPTLQRSCLSFPPTPSGLETQCHLRATQPEQQYLNKRQMLEKT